MTRVERRRFRRDHGLTNAMSRANRIHRVWHGMPLPRNFESITDQDRKLAIGKKIERYAKRHPGQVIPLMCDDTYHATSDLVLVTHEIQDDWMGVTVMMIPQCDGRPPAEFFLYPGHVNALLQELRKIQKRTRTIKGRERAWERRDVRWWRCRPKPPADLEAQA